MATEIREFRPGEALRDFIRVGHEVFRNDPAWVAPLEMELKDRMTPGKNPFWEHADGALYIAYQDGRPVGRVTVQVDHEHLRIHDDGVGFFGFFDTVEDAEVANELLAAATKWAERRGMKTLRGPISLSMNEEIGMLIEGFEHKPVVMMPHSRPYQKDLTEAAGFAKAKDLFSWRYDVTDLSGRAQRAWDQIQAMSDVNLRSVDKSNMKSELRIVMDIFNDAWKDNWGFVPTTESEVSKAAKDLALVIDEDMAFIAEVNGKPAGICICLPNLNEALEGLGGRLFPFGFAKLLYRLKVKRPKSARLMMLGLSSDVRGKKKYGALSMAMYAEVSRRGRAKGYEWGELSWTLEDNHRINLGIKAMGARVYKKYRVFERAL